MEDKFALTKALWHLFYLTQGNYNYISLEVVLTKENISFRNHVKFVLFTILFSLAVPTNLTHF